MKKWWRASGQKVAQKACSGHSREQLLWLVVVWLDLVGVAREGQKREDRSVEGEDKVADARAVCAPSGVREWLAA